MGDDSDDELCCLGGTVHVSKRLKAGDRFIMLINDLYRNCSWTEDVGGNRIGHLPGSEAQQEMLGGSLSDVLFLFPFLFWIRLVYWETNVVMPLKMVHISIYFKVHWSQNRYLLYHRDHSNLVCLGGQTDLLLTFEFLKPQQIDSKT